MAEDNELEQIINQPTRGMNTLDLIFTNKPELFGNLSTRNLKPASDHQLVHCEMTNTQSAGKVPHRKRALNCPEIAKFNFAEGNHAKFKQILKYTNW